MVEYTGDVYYGLRFTVEEGIVKDNETGNTIECNSIIELLNKLNEKNIRLEKDLLETQSILSILEDENKKLKQYHTDDLRHIQYLQLRLKE